MLPLLIGADTPQPSAAGTAPDDVDTLEGGAEAVIVNGADKSEQPEART